MNCLRLTNLYLRTLKQFCSPAQHSKLFSNVPNSENNSSINAETDLEALSVDTIQEIKARQWQQQQAEIPNGNGAAVLAPSTNYSNSFKELVKYLLECRLGKVYLVNAFAEPNSELPKFHKSLWKERVDILMGYCDLYAEEAAAALIMTPQLLKTETSKYIEHFENFASNNIANKKLRSLLRGAPEVLLLTPEQITGICKSLIQVFSNYDVTRIVSENPNVLVDPWDATQYKIHYIMFIMGADPHEMVNSNALSHSIEHIRLRHVFLERAGVYKKPNPKNRKVNKNPHLRTILDSSDRHFVQSIARLHLEEYAVFSELLETEKFENLLSKEDYVSDSEDDDE